MRVKLPSCPADRGFTAVLMPLFALLLLQPSAICSLKASPALRAQTSTGNMTSARGAPAVTSAEAPGSHPEPSQVRGKHLALVAPYLPSPKQTAAGDRTGISTCQTPGSGHPNGIPFPENKHKFIILVWLQRKTHLDSLFC